ncbi:hypothetical protein L6V77_18120 [Myxococcota bacterium]|nr:hypothetical protein [Myxococcota bacterium]
MSRRTWPSARAASLLLPLGYLVACQGPAPGLDVFAGVPDPVRFDTLAAPILERRCADVGCHGGDTRPYALYAVRRHRQDPADAFRATPLTLDERTANRVSAAGFVDATDPVDTILLKKALGALAHGGGAVFQHASDPEMMTLRRALERLP